MNTFDAFEGILMEVSHFQLMCFLSVWMQALQLQSPHFKVDNLNNLNFINPIIQMQVVKQCKQRSFCIVYQGCTVLYQALVPGILGRIEVNK